MKTLTEGIKKIVITQKCWLATNKRRSTSNMNNPNQTLAFNIYEDKEGFYILRGVEEKTNYLDYKLIGESYRAKIFRNDEGQLYTTLLQNSGAEINKCVKIIISIEN